MKKTVVVKVDRSIKKSVVLVPAKLVLLNKTYAVIIKIQSAFKHVLIYIPNITVGNDQTVAQRRIKASAVIIIIT